MLYSTVYQWTYCNFWLDANCILLLSVFVPILCRVRKSDINHASQTGCPVTKSSTSLNMWLCLTSVLPTNSDPCTSMLIYQTTVQIAVSALKACESFKK